MGIPGKPLQAEDIINSVLLTFDIFNDGLVEIRTFDNQDASRHHYSEPLTQGLWQIVPVQVLDYMIGLDQANRSIRIRKLFDITYQVRGMGFPPINIGIAFESLCSATKVQPQWVFAAQTELIPDLYDRRAGQASQFIYHIRALPIMGSG